MSKSFLYNFTKTTFQGYKKDNIASWAAALAYYTVFSIAPLLILVVSIAAFFFSEEQAKQQLLDLVSDLLGSETTTLIERLLTNISQPEEGILPTVIGIALLLFGASRVFSQLETSLNSIWQVKQKDKSGFKKTVKDKLFTFSMVGVLGFLFLVSLIASIAVSIVVQYFNELIPFPHFVITIIDFALPYTLTFILFLLIFRLLPDVLIPWKTIIIGSALSALLFSVGKSFIQLYITSNATVSAYGAAASIVILLLWVYYSAQILYIGVESMKAYAGLTGQKILTKEGSVRYSISTSEAKKEPKWREIIRSLLSFTVLTFLAKFLKRDKKQSKKQRKQKKK